MKIWCINCFSPKKIKNFKKVQIFQIMHFIFIEKTKIIRNSLKIKVIMDL